MLQKLSKTEIHENIKADQSMDALIGLIHQNINKPIDENVNKQIENIKFDIQSSSEKINKIEKELKVQNIKIKENFDEIHELIGDKSDENQNKIETLEELISDFKKNNFEMLEQSFEKIGESFNVLNLNIVTNKNSLLDELGQQLTTGFSNQQTTVLSHVDEQFKKNLDELKEQQKYQVDQWYTLFKTLQILSNQHISSLNSQSELISTLLIDFEKKISNKQDAIILQLIEKIESSSDLSLNKQQNKINQLQEFQKNRLDQQASELKALDENIKDQLAKNKKMQTMTLGISIINLLLIALIIYLGFSK
ncbi:hypothetical protein MOTT16_03130 [Moraxella osloensis]|uniref:Uncharacterized protein n=1 Tax=Faucicola osloensis TaxID=34062 RepID=A0AAD0ACZ3_FAUOS|nr:hypothetical protein [Moraxella osloensis]ATQ82900.1 hypothetical protein YHS_03135 [Moraxella osloensis]ATW85400.1 hypothetical protein MOTT16_03130 [Moraxella osloensis]